jgi:hypothetical protein
MGEMISPVHGVLIGMIGRFLRHLLTDSCPPSLDSTSEGVRTPSLRDERAASPKEFVSPIVSRASTSVNYDLFRVWLSVVERVGDLWTALFEPVKREAVATDSEYRSWCHTSGLYRNGKKVRVASVIAYRSGNAAGSGAGR